jgi:pantoate--beta-alanine ligase
MNRLTKIVNPQKIFMGEKDFQQLYLVKKLLERNYKVKIISCKTIRDKSKVALSSRNFLLDKSDLKVAANIYKKLLSIKKNIKNKKNILNFLNLKKIELRNNFKIKIDYLELRNINNLNISKTNKNSRLFVAYYLNKVRLIDNI